MLRNIKEIINYALKAKDGEIGRCKDFLFDDEKWTIRYMVADTYKWLPGRKVLISPISLGRPNWSTQRFYVALTRRQIQESPPLDENAPVSREYEKLYGSYFSMPPYWSGVDMWGNYPTPAGLQAANDASLEDVVRPEESHLRSTKEVTGYHIQAVDEEIGHVEDFIVDDDTWSLRYVVVDTRNWLPGRKVLVSPQWVTSVDWGEAKVYVDLTTDQIKDSPEYDPSTPVNRGYEITLYDYYGRPVYWE
jgi:hypothetical protein